jgi:prevent-host-death family protein
MTHTLPITKAREDLTTLVNNANHKLDEYIITVNGSPAAVLISAAEYQSWNETNEIMKDAGLLNAIRSGKKNIDQGKYITFAQLKKDLKLNV